MDVDDVIALAEWSEPEEIETKYGPRLLRKAGVTERFSEAWKTHRAEIKELGAGFGKTLDGKWELTWWQNLPDEVLAERARAVAESRASFADIDLPAPQGLEYMPFQKAGIRYALARPNVLIADQMGLGKTIQAIGVINADPTIDSALIICPKSLKLNWLRECRRWLTRNLDVAVVGDTWPETDIVIVHYEALAKFQPFIQFRNWGACVIDEAHFIKNPAAQRSQHAKSVPCRRKIRLTGTPICNRPIELFNLIEDLDDFGPYWKFARRYANAYNNGFGMDTSGHSRLDELQRKLRERVMVRRLKDEVLSELPRKIRQVIELEPDSAAQRHAVRAEGAYETDSEDRLADLRAQVELSKAESEEAYREAVDRLREATQVDFTEIARLRHETAVAKVPAVVEHVRLSLADNEGKIVIAAHHHDVIDGLMEELAEFRPVCLTGRDSEEERMAAVDSFQGDPAVRVFVGSIMAAGVGITLTAASHVIFGELDWVPGNITQFEDRCHRIGATQTVLVQHLVLSGSIDARMAHMLVEKQHVIDQALDTNHPERSMLVFTPRAAAATHSAGAKDIAAIAEQLSEEQIRAAHEGLRILAGMDTDYASELNGVGFSKIDVQIGHSLAACDRLTPKQAVLGMKLVKKYKRQLPESILEAMERL